MEIAAPSRPASYNFFMGRAGRPKGEVIATPERGSGAIAELNMISLGKIRENREEIVTRSRHAVVNGDMRELATVMKLWDPDFKEEDFLEELRDSYGNWRGLVDDEDYREMLEEDIRERVDLDYFAKERIKDMTGRPLDDDEEEFFLEENKAEIIDSIIRNPENNPYIALRAPSREEWLLEENLEAIRHALRRAGGSEDALNELQDPAELFERASKLEHRPDSDVSVFDDSDSDQFFINLKDKNFYGNRRRYVATVDGSDRNIEINEVRNRDGRALRLHSHGIEVAVVETASGAVEYESSLGRKEATKEQVESHGGLEGLALHLLEGEVRLPEAQADRLFESL